MKTDYPEIATIEEWQTQFNGLPENANSVQVTIGFDFGTAFTKVVIDAAGQKYGVPLNDDKQGTDKYLLPTCLYEDLNGNFSIAQPKNWRSSHVDLKMRILDSVDINVDKETKKYIIAYLVRVLQKTRSWLMNEKRDVLGASLLRWYINIGLPAEKYTGLEEMYRQLVGQAWRESTVAQSSEECELHPDRIGVFPEFAAQIQGYISSPQRKTDIHALVDIGAGTIDSAVFIVHSSIELGEAKYPILAKSVKPLGTTYLARHRCKELNPFSNWKPDPQNLFPKLEEFTEKLNVRLDAITIADDKFSQQVMSTQFIPLLKDAKQMAPIQTVWEKGVPLILCGGGARVEFYQEVMQRLRNWGGPVYSLEESRLPALTGLEAPGLLEQDKDRLSVAHGLSFDAFQIGEIIHPEPFSNNKSTDTTRRMCPLCNGTGGYGNCRTCDGKGFL